MMKNQAMTSKYGKIVLLIHALLISFACTVQFHVPVKVSAYEEKIDFLTAQIYELLGQYNFVGLLIFVMAYVMLIYCKEQSCCRMEGNGYGLPLFLSVCLFLGRSYKEVGSWQYCFGSAVNFLKFIFAVVGMSILLRYVIAFFLCGLEKLCNSKFSNRLTNRLFGKNSLWINALVIWAVWFPMILLSYPGNLCYDVIGQIEQVVGNQPYSAHHPLLHTLIVGGLVKLGGVLFHSYEVGLFVYILFQSAMLAFALAGTIWWLAKQSFSGKKISHAFLLILLLIYTLSPVYSNVASTALKDVPFVAMFIWYMIMLAELYRKKERLTDVKFVALFVLVQILVSLLRNNGFYVIFLTGLMLCIIWWKRVEKKHRILQMTVLFAAPVVLSKLLGIMLAVGLSAQEGKAAEMFSLPFQQTARYLQLYGSELNAEEINAIENVLGDVNEVAAAYDPDIADPVKIFYYNHDQVTVGELAAYFKYWAQGFVKHPGVYFEAFFAHVYGWFDPQVSNAVRYEATYNLIPREGLFVDADKVALFIYRFADRITPLGIIQNVGVYTWLLLILVRYCKVQNKKGMALLIPLLISLLICMASPCFYLHPRYAFPYMFTIPFLYGFIERSRE